MLTVEDVANHWRVRPAAVRARIAAGELRAVRIAGRYRTTWPDVWSCETGRAPSGALADRYTTPLMTKADLAQAMRVSVRTVERWIYEGLPNRPVFGRTRFNRSEAAAWIRARFEIDVRQVLGISEARPAADRLA